MAPRKKTPRVKAQESSKESPTEYSPVKATTSVNDAQTPAMCTTRGRSDYDPSEESPSPGIFSPVNKPTCDIEWAWKSPKGRLGSAASANTTKRRLLNKTPVQKTKRCAKANSPLNHFPSKRKLIKAEDEDSDHLSILTSQLEALKQCVLGDQNPETSAGLPTVRTPPNKKEAKSDDSLTALLDDDNYFTLLQCSQYVEEKLIDNPNKTVFSPINVRGISALNQTAAPEPDSSSHARVAMTTSTSEPRAANQTKQTTVIEAVASASRVDVTKPVIARLSPTREKPVETYKFDINFADDSFDDVLANFCDENLELLSQGKSASQQETSDNVLALSGEEKQANLPSSPELKTSSIAQEITCIAAGSRVATASDCSSTSYSFDDDFLQPDLLKMLDAIESSDLQKAPSPPHQCTPEEIEKKRQEAKMKLEKRKRAAVVETNRLPSRSSFGNVRR